MTAMLSDRSRELRDALDRRRDELHEVLTRFGARNPRIFGSVARGDATGTSDIDVLADLPQDMSLFELARLERELSAILNVHVDVVPAGKLRASIRPRALEEAVPL